MSTTRWAGRRPALLMAILLVAVLAACAAGAGGAPAFQDAGDEGAGAGGAPAELDGGDRAGGGEGEEEPGGGLFAPSEQRIVKTGEITLEVENVGEMIGRVRAMATTLNGYVGGS